MLRQQAKKNNQNNTHNSGIIQPQRPNYLCWLPINPLSCSGSTARPTAPFSQINVLHHQIEMLQSFVTASVLASSLFSKCLHLYFQRIRKKMATAFRRSQQPSSHSTQTRPFYCRRVYVVAPSLAYLDWLSGLTICKTALMVLMTFKAANDCLLDKPLDLCGMLRGASGPARVLRLTALRTEDIKFVYTLPAESS